MYSGRNLPTFRRGVLCLVPLCLRYCSPLKLETVRSSETSVNLCCTVLGHILNVIHHKIASSNSIISSFRTMFITTLHSTCIQYSECRGLADGVLLCGLEVSSSNLSSGIHYRDFTLLLSFPSDK
jgi:hypothetical protein